MKSIRILLIFSMVFLFVPLNGKAAQSHEKVRVGYYNNNFHYREEDGTYGGYGHEYLQEIAKYTGWDYEYVPGTLKECHERLKTGEIDLLGAVQHTKEREEYLDYPELSSGISYAILCTKSSNNNLAYNDYSAFDGKKVGLLQESNNNELFYNFCKEKDVRFRKFYYDSQEELNNALIENKVDLVLTNIIRKEKDQKVVAQFSPSEFYFVTSKGNDKILTALNEAQEQVKIINPNYDALLFTKYYQDRSSGDFVLTKEEMEHVFRMNAVKVAVIENLRPIQSYNSKTNEFTGISTDLLEVITDITGIQFEFIPAEDYSSAIALLKQEKVDMVCGIPEIFNPMYEESILKSSPYLKGQMVMVKNRAVENLENINIAMLESEKLPVDLENSNIVHYDTLEECINSVNSGKTDVYYGNIYVIEEVLQNPKLNNIVLSTAVNVDSNICFGFRRQGDVKFNTLFNKALNYISDNEIQEIIYKNTLAKRTKITMSSILYLRPDIFAIAIIIIAITITCSVVYSFYNRLKNQKLLAKSAVIQGERYRVATEITNDILFEYDIETDTMTNAQKFAEIFGRNPVIAKFLEKKEEIQNVQSEDWNVYKDFCNSLNSGKEMVESEFRIMGKDGVYVWCHLRGKTIFNKNRKPIKVIGKIVNIDIQKKELEKLIFKAQRDPLTNLYNKTNTKDLINCRLLNRFSEEYYSLMIIDIDNFKNINDTYGHLTGDMVLSGIVMKMKEVFSEEDVLGRIGGDEFVILMKYIEGTDMVDKKAKSLGDGVATTIFHEDPSLRVTISIGIADYPLDGKNYDELLEHADKALYSVKNQGKNHFNH